MNQYLLISFFTIFWCAQSFSQPVIVPVGKAEASLKKLLVYGITVGKDDLSAQDRITVQKIWDIVLNDFAFYRKKFETLKISEAFPSSQQEELIKNQQKLFDILLSPQFLLEKKKKAQFVFQAFSSSPSPIKLVYDFNWEDVKNDHGPKVRATAHDIGLQLFKKLAPLLNNKLESVTPIFKSKIVFVSDKHSTLKEKIKELYLMDFDGHNTRRLTHHQGIVISPAFSHSGEFIAYSLIQPKLAKNSIDLYLFNLRNGHSEKISSLPGINSGAVFTPQDDAIFLTLSYKGNSDIYRFDLKTKALSPITQHRSDDVDPSLTSDGKKMAFLSDRPGKAMIYTLDPSGVEKDVTRVSFIGQFNATPQFSPDGQTIVFSSFDGNMDIFSFSLIGKATRRLTSQFGRNEDPHFSLDGNFILFSSSQSSKHGGTQELYLMDNEDGDVIGNLTQGNFGRCHSARLSRVPH